MVAAPTGGSSLARAGDPPAVQATDAAGAAVSATSLDTAFNTGKDSHFCLVDGYSVIGVDANPDLIAAVRIRFADATAEGALTLVSNGLEGEAADPNSAPERFRFNRSKLRSDWSSFGTSLGCRNPNNTPIEKEEPAHCERIDVLVTTCAGLIERCGMPLYMKIDSEVFSAFGW
ncbi:hypothetical protein I4F81_003744 [Pyropia yezoensis]|uniref:Uncharacterized protein n=1 Tax=Pyropia yezoensis TaxID=2788 RepID=A0ACC3BTF8_PYRYE|nr:hypothetical protein I4F81_003744 [Neopyropia yezoensis]